MIKQSRQDNINYHVLYNNIKHELKLIYKRHNYKAFNIIVQYLHGATLNDSKYLMEIREALSEDAGHWQGLCRVVSRINKRLGRRSRGYWTKREKYK